MPEKKEDAFIHILTDSYLPLRNFVNLPDASKQVELDLGCGKGSFTALLAQRYPEKFVLAADIMIGRLRKLVRKRNRLELKNLEPLRTEARILLARFLPDASINRLHMLCPDPWPKLRHKGHRLLSSDLAGQIHRILRSGGIFHFSTDATEYFEAGCAAIEDSGLFTRDDSAINDITDLKTDFERRWNKQGLEVNHAAWLRG